MDKLIEEKKKRSQFQAVHFLRIYSATYWAAGVCVRSKSRHIDYKLSEVFHPTHLDTTMARWAINSPRQSFPG